MITLTLAELMGLNEWSLLKVRLHMQLSATLYGRGCRNLPLDLDAEPRIFEEFEHSFKLLAIHSISMESFDLFGLPTVELQQFPTQHSLDRLRSRAKCIPPAQ